jgi:cytochrome c oxidase subunit 1
VVRSWRFGEKVEVDDPWGFGNSLEWATTCPPPRHNFLELPRVRSERPAFELHYPHMVERLHDEGHITLTGRPVPHAEAMATPSEKVSGGGHHRGD